jgi:hypothetical protein
MPITWRVSGSGGRIDVVFTDPYTGPESEKVMREIFAAPGVTRPLGLLVDVRHSAAPDTEFVVNATTFFQLHVHEMWGAKVAVVAATEGQVGMGHMSERTAESRDLPFTVRVFRESEWHEAEQWLGHPE